MAEWPVKGLISVFREAVYLWPVCMDPADGAVMHTLSWGPCTSWVDPLQNHHQEIG